MSTYTKPTLVNYNDNPPTNDGSEDDVNNLVDWDKRTIAEVGDPLKDYSDGINNETFAAFNLVEAKYVTSVKDSDYGATGDGTTDDQSAIQATIDAVEAAGGGVVYFPKGEYLVKSGLVIDSNNVYLVGEGRGSEITYDLTLDQEIDVIKFSAVAHGGVLGLYINCANGDATSGYGAIAVRGASSFIGIENIVVDGHNSGLILEDPCTDCWIDQCVVDGQLRHNIRQVGAARCRITNNTLTGASREPVLFNAPSSGTVKDLIFNNNYIEAPNTFDFIQIATSTTPTYTRLKFTENTFIDNGTAKDGINTNGLSITGCDISHNDFVGGRLGFELYLAEDCTIDNNRVSGCEESGIVLLGSINNLISNNIVKNCDQISASGNKGGITLRDNGGNGSSNNTIIGNRCYDDQGSKTQTYGIKIVDATCIDNEISGNNLDGNLTGKISDAGVANRIDTPSSEYVKTLDSSTTPSVEGGHYFLSNGGTNSITDFDDGIAYQVIVVLFGHSITVTDGANIFLSAGGNQLFVNGDSLTLIQKADGLWYELARSVG